MTFRFDHQPIRADRFDTDGLLSEVRGALRDTVAEGNRFIARYPPQRLLKSGYRRTGTLKRSWSFKLSTLGQSLTGEVGSNSRIAPYNKFVQGSPQVRIFRQAGWQNIDDLERKMENDFIKEIDGIFRRGVA